MSKAANTPQGGMRSMVWFRTDLRTRDHAALAHACAAQVEKGVSPGGVVGLFVISPGEWRAHDWACVKVEFVLRTLRELSAALARLNIPLLIRTAKGPGEVPSVVARAAREVGAARVDFNREYEVNERRRDEAVTRALEAQGVRVFAWHDQCALEPGCVRTGAGGPFTVFTPFRKAWLRVSAERGGLKDLGVPAAQKKIDLEPDEVPGRVPGFGSDIAPEHWPAGEAEALRRLKVFVRERGRAYKDRRDFPAVEGTSALSPYLAIGAISPRICVRAAAEANNGALDGGSAGLAGWISELIWREFYIHVVEAFPRVCMHRAFKPAAERVAWRTDEAQLLAWKEGRTGYPIVDAAMRQLRTLGWMHNRLRMISAMFLTKDLLIDWRLGERFFMQNLVDGFLPSNNGGWQWSASTGTDAQPYFRIFNPFSQSERFDPDGTFIRAWVPELRGVRGAAVHQPHDSKKGVSPLERAKLDYPPPIVDHAKARERVLKAFKLAAGGAEIGAGEDLDND